MMKASIFLVCLFFVLNASNFCMREKELTDVEFYNLLGTEYFKGKPFKLVETECSDVRDNSTCLYIIDRIGYFPDGEWFVGRFVTPVPNLNKGFLSVSKLTKPTFKSKSTIDTSIWPVDIGMMDVLTPNGVEFSFLFSTGQFPLNRDITGDVLLIGVATGGLMSYIGHYFKNLNLVGVDIDPNSEYLAKKWFGYVDRSRSKILIDDGAEYIKKMAERGETSNAVLVDACHNNEPTDNLYCPVAAVRTPRFLSDLSKVIGKRGFSAFNTYHKMNWKKGYEEMRDSFRKHFEKCELIDADKLISNMFLICANHDWEQNEVDQTEVQQFLNKFRLQPFLQYLV
ncbi:unnamed protein product [Caenorhabditis sp. 36 PRJEB53466]|nr:unnamed protein product [Caenorhabditis sp. 36 PRJEB53466]